MSEQIMTTGDAARKFNVSGEYVRRLTAAGKLSATRTVSGQYLFEASEIERLAAERAEVRIRLEIFEQKFGDGPSKNFSEFVREEYDPWARANKRSYNKADRLYLVPILEFFGDYRMRGDKPRKPVSVNREVQCLSRIFALARDAGLVASNPCQVAA